MSGLMYPKEEKKKKRKMHPKSILHPDNGTCYLCILLHGDYRCHPVLQEHHIFGGPNRPISEAYGLKAKLCLDHHLDGDEAVHQNAEIMELMHREGQQAFELTHSRTDFIRLFGRNYMD